MSLVPGTFQKIRSYYLILFGTALAATFWLIESAVDAFVFGLGSFSERLIPPDPNEVWMRLVVFSLVLLFSAYAQALVSRYRRIERDLRRERNFSASILSTAGALVVVLDRQGRIIDFNHACEQTTGYAFAEVKGVPFWDRFLVPEEIDAVKEVFSELRAGRFPNTYENYWLTKEGERRLISWSNTALLDSAGAVEYVIGTGIDITERTRLERESRNMLSMFAHDMKNPLVTAGGFVARLLSGKEGPLDDRQRAALKVIDEECSVLKDLVSDFLEFSRLEAREHRPNLAPFDIKTELYRRIEAVKAEAAGKGVRVLADIRESAPDTVMADGVMVSRAVGNLLDNAVKYTERGGSVTVRFLKADARLLIEVADTGIGIAAAHLPHIFEPFYRVGTDSRGSGLGLAIVRRAVEAHGGAVKVESSPGKGSTFTIILPVSSM